MFGSLGIWEILVIFILALLLFGPRKLPEIGRAIGKGLGEFRKASNDLKRAFNAETALEEDEARPSFRSGHLPTRPPELANRGPVPAALVPEADEETPSVGVAEAALVESTDGASAETVARQPSAAETPLTTI